MALVYSARTTADIIFDDELHTMHARRDGFHFIPTLTREQNAAPGRRVGRIDRQLLADVLALLQFTPKLVFVCGANPFVEAATDALLALGVLPSTVRTERYGG